MSQNNGVRAKADDGKTKPGETAVTFSESLPEFLIHHSISLVFSSYQTGRVYFLGPGFGDKLALHSTSFPHTTGIAGDADSLWLATQVQLVRLENIVPAGKRFNDANDAAYVPRAFYTIGKVDMHELGVNADGEPVFVNTKYSCLATLSRKNSFKPVWKPSFISQLAPEDRCHLNGLCMENGAPRYVTAVAESDESAGWREKREDGGIVIDALSGEIIARGLSLPHSPRLRDGELWVLNSGAGEVGRIDRASGAFDALAFCPGFLRGLAFVGDYAIVTLSKPRPDKLVGLALDGRLADHGNEPWCALQAISLKDGSLAAWIRFEGAVDEFFDVRPLNGVRNAVTFGVNEIERFITIGA